MRPPWWASDRFWKIAGPFVFALAVLASTALLWVPLVLPAKAAIIFQPNYQAADPLAAGWQAIEAAAPDRVTLQGNQLRIEIRPGDTWTSGNGYVAHRAEVRGLRASRSTPPTLWPLCEACERWDRQQLYVPPDWTTTADGTVWLVIVQFKGLNSGSPPVALEAKRDRWQLSACGTRFDLGPIVPGMAPVFDVGMFLSPTSMTGWIEAWFNHVQRVARRPCATLDDYWDASAGIMRTDPIYLKNGIYRSYAWDGLGVTHVLYYNAPLITDARPF